MLDSYCSMKIFNLSQIRVDHWFMFIFFHIQNFDFYSRKHWQWDNVSRTMSHRFHFHEKAVKRVVASENILYILIGYLHIIWAHYCLFVTQSWRTSQHRGNLSRDVINAARRRLRSSGRRSVELRILGIGWTRSASRLN